MAGNVHDGNWADYAPCIQAILDEYARAIHDLEGVVTAIPPDSYVGSTALADEEFPNIRAIMEHVIGCTHIYVDYIEDAVDKIDRGRRGHVFAYDTPAEAVASVWHGFERMVDLLGRLNDWRDEDLEAVRFVTRWEQPYDIEQMLEHAIVHILRHRRQLERWLARPRMP